MTDAEIQKSLDEAKELTLDTTLLSEKTVAEFRQVHELKYIENYLQMQEEQKLVDTLEEDLKKLPAKAQEDAAAFLAIKDEKTRKKKAADYLGDEDGKKAIQLASVLPSKRLEVIRIKRTAEHYAKLIKKLDAVEAARAKGAAFKG